MSDQLNQEIETYLLETFEENFAWLLAETGAGLAPDIKNMALQQVLFYWRKLNDIATRVTETEVRLNLPGQVSPLGRDYGIEGVVDIVREEDHTTMYDIKTHDPAYVREHWVDYAKQLNLYAYIWGTLREQTLDETAVIATALPDSMREALARRDDQRLLDEMERWEPLIDIPFDTADVHQVVEEFGAIVDAIEDGSFSPPSVDVLNSRLEDDARNFATRICRNCDARYSCGSYRNYMRSTHGRRDAAFEIYLQEDIPEWEGEERLAQWLDVAPEPEALLDLLD